MSNKLAIRYYGRAPLNNKEEAAYEIKLLHDRFESSKSIKWALIRDNDNSYIGSVGIKEFMNIHRRGTLSIVLSPECRGCGYANEALTTIINYCFKELCLNRLQAFVDPENSYAMSLFSKLGFRMESILNEYEMSKYIDIAIWGLIKEKVTIYYFTPKIKNSAARTTEKNYSFDWYGLYHTHAVHQVQYFNAPSLCENFTFHK